MTREEKAQEFARNCAEYNNLPIEVEHLLHTAFIVGYNERDDEEKNPWHKVSEELPKEEGTYLLRFCVGCSFQISIGSYRDGKFGALTMEDGDYVTHWMEIPPVN